MRGDGGDERAFRADIEGLRAVSVIAVIVYHAYPNRLPGGFTGVDVFFVISGYLITRLLVAEFARDDRINLVAFWARRIRRILPLATVVLVVTIGFALLTPALDVRALAPHAIAAALFVHNLHQAREVTDYLAGSHAENPLLHYWSLSIEEQFYLLWPPILLALLVVARRRGGMRLVAAAGGLLVAASFVFNLSLTNQEPALAFFHPAARAWQLGLGALFALAEPALAARSAKGGEGARRCAALARVLAWAGAAGLSASFLLFDATTPYPGLAALAPTLSALALVAAHSLAATSIGAVLSTVPMQWIGRLSFGWYLWHWPALVFGRPSSVPMSRSTSA